MVTQAQQQMRVYPNLIVAGWREWVGLPDLGVARLKAKFDSGARTSTLHAFDIEHLKIQDRDVLRFKVHPQQRQSKRTILCEADLVDERLVRSSSGHSSLRPVISTKLAIGCHTWEIELTLTNRDQMGFRMLIGRQAMRRHLLIHPGRSYILGSEKNAHRG